MDREFKCHLCGWMLFILCALFFMASSVAHQDTAAFIGSVIFLVACIVFLIPLFDKKHARGKPLSGDNAAADAREAAEGLRKENDRLRSQLGALRESSAKQGGKPSA